MLCICIDVLSRCYVSMLEHLFRAHLLVQALYKATVHQTIESSFEVIRNTVMTKIAW